MVFDNSIKVAIIISVFFHSIIFFAWPAISIFFPKKAVRPFEITYCRIKSPKIVMPKRLPLPKETPPVEKNLSKITQAQKEKIMAVKRKQEEHDKKSLPKTEQPKKDLADVVKSDIVIPPIPAGLEKLPAYLDYVQSVREKIKRVANRKYRKSYPTGEVFLNFVLLSSGELSVIKIIGERSCSNEYLRKIALESIQDASPFDSFPSDLEFKELSFSVVISFE